MSFENKIPELSRINEGTRNEDFIAITEFKEVAKRLDDIINKLRVTTVSKSDEAEGLARRIKELMYHIDDALIYDPDTGKITGFNQILNENDKYESILGPESFTNMVKQLNDYYNEFVRLMGSDPNVDNWQIDLQAYFDAAMGVFKDKINAAFTSSANVSILEAKYSDDMNYMQSDAVPMNKSSVLRLNPDVNSYMRSINIIPKERNASIVIFEIQESEKQTLVLNLKVQTGFMYYDLDVVLDKGKWSISKESVVSSDNIVVTGGLFFLDIYKYSKSGRADAYVFCLRSRHTDLSVHYNFEITNILGQNYDFNSTNLDVTSHSKYYNYIPVEAGTEPIYNKVYYIKEQEKGKDNEGNAVTRPVYVGVTNLLSFKPDVEYYDRVSNFELVKSYDIVDDESDGNISKEGYLKKVSDQVVVEDIKHNGDLSLMHLTYDIDEAFDNTNPEDKVSYLIDHNKISLNKSSRYYNITNNLKPTIAITQKNNQFNNEPETVAAYGNNIFEFVKLKPGNIVSTNAFINAGATAIINRALKGVWEYDSVDFNSKKDVLTAEKTTSEGYFTYTPFIEKWQIVQNVNNASGNVDFVKVNETFSEGTKFAGFNKTVNDYIRKNVAFVDNVLIQVFNWTAANTTNDRKCFLIVIIPDVMEEGKIKTSIAKDQFYYSFLVNMTPKVNTEIDEKNSISAIVYRSTTIRESDEYLYNRDDFDLGGECYGLVSNESVTLAFGKNGIYYSYFGDVWYLGSSLPEGATNYKINNTSPLKIHKEDGIFGLLSANTDIVNSLDGPSVKQTVRNNVDDLDWLLNPDNEYFVLDKRFYVFTKKSFLGISPNSSNANDPYTYKFNICYISDNGFDWYASICPSFTRIKPYASERIVFIDDNAHTASVMGKYIISLIAGKESLYIDDSGTKYNFESVFKDMPTEYTCEIKIPRPQIQFLDWTLVHTDELPADYPGYGALNVPKSNYEEVVSRFNVDANGNDTTGPAKYYRAKYQSEIMPVYDVGYNHNTWLINCGDAFFFAKENTSGTFNKFIKFETEDFDNLDSGVALFEEELRDMMPFYGSFHPEDRYDFSKYKIFTAKYCDFIIYRDKEIGKMWVPASADGNSQKEEVPVNKDLPIFTCSDGVILRRPSVYLNQYKPDDTYENALVDFDSMSRYANRSPDAADRIEYFTLNGGWSYEMHDVNKGPDEYGNVTETPFMKAILTDNNGYAFEITECDQNENDRFTIVEDPNVGHFGPNNDESNIWTRGSSRPAITFDKILYSATDRFINTSEKSQNNTCVNGVLQLVTFNGTNSVCVESCNINEPGFIPMTPGDFTCAPGKLKMTRIAFDSYSLHPMASNTDIGISKNNNQYHSVYCMFDGHTIRFMIQNTGDSDFQNQIINYAKLNKQGFVTDILNDNHKYLVTINEKIYERNYGYDDTYCLSDINFIDDNERESITTKWFKQFDDYMLDIEVQNSIINGVSYVLHRYKLNKTTKKYEDTPATFTIPNDGVLDDYILSVNSSAERSNGSSVISNKFIYFITYSGDIYCARYDHSMSTLTLTQSSIGGDLIEYGTSQIKGFCENSNGLFIYGSRKDTNCPAERVGEYIWFSSKKNEQPTFRVLLKATKIDCVQIINDEVFISAYDENNNFKCYVFDDDSETCSELTLDNSGEVFSFNYVFERSNNTRYIFNGTGSNPEAGINFCLISKQTLRNGNSIIKLTPSGFATDYSSKVFKDDVARNPNGTIKYPIKFNRIEIAENQDLVAMTLNCNPDPEDTDVHEITRVLRVYTDNGGFDVIYDSANPSSDNIPIDIFEELRSLMYNTDSLYDRNVFGQTFISQKTAYGLRIGTKETIDNFSIDEIFFDRKTKTMVTDYSSEKERKNCSKFLNNYTFAVNSTTDLKSTTIAMIFGKNSIGINTENKLVLFDKANKIFRVFDLCYDAKDEYNNMQIHRDIDLTEEGFNLACIVVGANSIGTRLYVAVQGKFPRLVVKDRVAVPDYNVESSIRLFRIDTDEALKNTTSLLKLEECQTFELSGNNDSLDILRESVKEYILTNDSGMLPNTDLPFDLTVTDTKEPLMYIGNFLGVLYESAYSLMYFNWERNCFHFKTEVDYEDEIKNLRDYDAGEPYKNSKFMEGYTYFETDSGFIRDDSKPSKFNPLTDLVEAKPRIALNLTNKKMIDLKNNHDLLTLNSWSMYGRHMQTQYGVFRYMPASHLRMFNIYNPPAQEGDGFTFNTSYVNRFLKAKNISVSDIETWKFNQTDIYSDGEGDPTSATGRNYGYHAWFTAEGSNKITEIIPPNGGCITNIFETLRGVFIDAIVPEEYDATNIHGGHKLYRMDKVPMNGLKSIIVLSDTNYFTEMSNGGGKCTIDMKDTEQGLIAVMNAITMDNFRSTDSRFNNDDPNMKCSYIMQYNGDDFYELFTVTNGKLGKLISYNGEIAAPYKSYADMSYGFVALHTDGRVENLSGKSINANPNTDEDEDNGFFAENSSFGCHHNGDTGTLCYPLKQFSARDGDNSDICIIENTHRSGQTHSMKKFSFTSATDGTSYQHNVTYETDVGNQDYGLNSCNSIGYPYIQKQYSDPKMQLARFLGAMVNNGIPSNKKMKAMGNIIYKDFKISVNGVKVNAIENGDETTTLDSITFNIDPEFRTSNTSLLHEMADGTLTISGDDNFKKCDLVVFYDAN